MLYDSVIVGGGIAGLQAAIQLGRYEHEVIVIDAGYGRSTLCRCYHNLLGWPDGVSGEKLRQLGLIHAKKLGIQFFQDKAIDAKKTEEGFVVHTAKGGRAFRGEHCCWQQGCSTVFRTCLVSISVSWPLHLCLPRL